MGHPEKYNFSKFFYLFSSKKFYLLDEYKDDADKKKESTDVNQLKDKMKEIKGALLNLTNLVKENMTKVRFEIQEIFSFPTQLDNKNSVFANQAVQFPIHKTTFQIEADWFLKCHKNVILFH